MDFRSEMPAEEFPLLITEKAISMAKTAIKSGSEDNLFLRISVKGGGCAGLKYNLDMDDRLGKFDVRCSFGDLLIVADAFSLHYLAETTIDYEESLEGAGFKFKNPNARRTCGCGSSFS
jgi:iron-sulfur cluster assembly accessory protein